jgi:tetratricopeptide (TPR) repeat protein
VPTGSWDARIDAFWASADPTRPDETLATMRGLVAERAADDPDALYEWASVHDFLGREAEAIPLYRAALHTGLAGDRRPQAIVQLASSLRNAGDADAAVRLLEAHAPHPVTGAAAQAFLALALHDAGRPAEALRVALTALAPTLPLYSRAVAAYAEDLRPRAEG